MKHARWLVGLSLGLGCGCAGGAPDGKDSAVALEAGNLCDEHVPAEHIVDGIPAYSSCDAAIGAIYSNNGVNTRSSSGGPDWVRTQWAYGYQCTEYVHRYLLFKWGINAIFDLNAFEFCAFPLPPNLGKTTTPVHGDVIVIAPNTCGAGGTGHIAVIDTVNAIPAQVTVVDQNRTGKGGRGTYATACATCFLHPTANTRSP